MKGNAIRVARAVSRVTRQAQQTPFSGLCARPSWSTLAGPSANGGPHIRSIQGASKVHSPELQQAPKVDNSMPVTIIQGSIQLPGTTANTSTEYQNADGLRFDDGRYGAFQNEISGFIPEARQFTDPVHTFAYGTDASFYRLNPKLVVKVHNEDEVKGCITSAAKHMTPVTFRAAGTSLSGQAITDSVLLKLSHTGKNFRNFEVKVVRLLLPSWSICSKAHSRYTAAF
ncbi:hypothetical protein CYMTET_39524 [Cymbomonas tetramitiformis]|uniref:FAD linked oxidase N-terminal domain-containing protein n=1 Tax=Cymbomonas tetramitiformis TaxID=36881 RepID=A0AAE0CAY7_9CHLO|nr:hypothetical protein CYMTET_39524 [Cymbomonas tetramitiformis]